MKGWEEPQIRTIEIENPTPLITLPKEPVVFEEAIKLLEEYPDDKPAYIRLNVLIKDYLAPDCNERASNAVKEKTVNTAISSPTAKNGLQTM